MQSEKHLSEDELVTKRFVRSVKTYLEIRTHFLKLVKLQTLKHL